MISITYEGPRSDTWSDSVRPRAQQSAVVAAVAVQDGTGDDIQARAPQAGHGFAPRKVFAFTAPQPAFIGEHLCRAGRVQPATDFMLPRLRQDQIVPLLRGGIQPPPAAAIDGTFVIDPIR